MDTIGKMDDIEAIGLLIIIAVSMIASAVLVSLVNVVLLRHRRRAA